MRVQPNLLFCLALATLALAQNDPQPSEDRMSAQRSNQDFHDLLNALPEESLHAALSGQLQSKFQDGVFEYDRKAVEAVHSADPPLATKLILNAAKHDLIRRQNATTPTSSTSSSSAVVVSTTDSSGRPSSQTTSVPAPPPTTTSSVPVTRPSSSGSGPAPTNTGSNGISFETSSTPDGNVVSSVVLQTTTLSNGQLVTITSFATVKPTRAPQASETSSGGGGSDLQSDAVSRFRPSMLPLFGAAFVGVFLM